MMILPFPYTSWVLLCRGIVSHLEEKVPRKPRSHALRRQQPDDLTMGWKCPSGVCEMEARHHGVLPIAPCWGSSGTLIYA